MTQLAQNTVQFKNTYCVIDLETTGLDSKSDAIIEVAAIRFDKDGVDQTFQSFVNPGRKIPRFIEDLTGISQQDVRSAPKIADLNPQLEEFIGDSVLIGHNIGFDVGFLNESGLKWEGASFDKNGIQKGGKTHGGSNHATGWNNQFALTYELGLYYNFTLEGPAFIPSGCPGIDMPRKEYPYGLDGSAAGTI